MGKGKQLTELTYQQLLSRANSETSEREKLSKAVKILEAERNEASEEARHAAIRSHDLVDALARAEARCHQIEAELYQTKKANQRLEINLELSRGSIIHDQQNAREISERINQNPVDLSQQRQSFSDLSQAYGKIKPDPDSHRRVPKKNNAQLIIMDSIKADLTQLINNLEMFRSGTNEEFKCSLEQLGDAIREFCGRIPRPYFYLGNGRGLTHLSSGEPFFVATKDRSIAPWIMMGGVWETFADEIVSSYIRPGMRVIDVGANLGYYTVKWGALIGSEGVLHAFEPNPDILDVLRENININGLKFRCHFHPEAAGREAGTGTLTFGYSNLGNAGFHQSHQVDRTYQVAIVAIDEVLAELDRVDLFKIDAEGYEPEVLAGAAQLISRSPNCAFHIEVQLAWERFGNIEAILAPLLVGRSLFVMRHDKKLVPTGLDHIREYVEKSQHKMADLFICPDGAAFRERVAQYMDHNSNV